MPSTAPEMSERMTATRNGTRNHVGRIVASVPIGSDGMPASTSALEAESMRPKTTRSTGAIAPPKVFQKTIAPPGAERRW